MRLRFEELPDGFIPRSQAVWGGNLAEGSRIDEQLIATVVARWRGAATGNRPEPAIGVSPLRSRETAQWPPRSYRQ